MAPALKPDQRTKKVKVLRAFYWQQKPIAAGEVIELPASFAGEMVSARKAAFVDPPDPPTPSHQQKADAERGGPETRFGPGGAPPASPAAGGGGKAKSARD